MKRIMNLTAAAALIFSLALLFIATSGTAYAQQAGKTSDKGFVDRDGDGINDNAKDDDGDGIPNGQDPDYTKNNAMNGKGQKGFVDADGDGINDLAKDDDGDGIPNGKDPDYVPPKDGSGQQMGNANKGGQGKGPKVDGETSQNQNQVKGKNQNMREERNRISGFVDENGDGINDRALDSDGDGIPNGKDPDYNKPQDGSGQKISNGRKNVSGNSGNGTGTCDGTGPKGKTSKKPGAEIKRSKQ